MSSRRTYWSTMAVLGKVVPKQAERARGMSGEEIETSQDETWT